MPSSHRFNGKEPIIMPSMISRLLIYRFILDSNFVEFYYLKKNTVYFSQLNDFSSCKAESYVIQNSPILVDVFFCWWKSIEMFFSVDLTLFFLFNTIECVQRIKHNTLVSRVCLLSFQKYWWIPFLNQLKIMQHKNLLKCLLMEISKNIIQFQGYT